MMQCVLGVLAAISACLSNLPWAAKPVVAACALACAYRMARKEWQASPVALQFSGSDGTALIGSGMHVRALTGVTVQVRGGFGWLTGSAADGRTVRLLWPPDRLGPGRRRLMRLASGATSRSIDPTFATLSG